MRKAAAVLAGLALALAGCTSAAQPQASRSPSPSSGPSLHALRRAADLAPCPRAGPPAASGMPATPSASPAGSTLPALRLPCLGGGPDVRLATLRGTPMLVNIWASWCGPCQREVPYLQAVHEDSGGRLRILGIDNVDSSGSALDFAAHAGMTYPSAVDKQGTVLRSTGAVGPPVTLFVSSDGAVVHTKIGPFADESGVRRAVARYLGVQL